MVVEYHDYRNQSIGTQTTNHTLSDWLWRHICVTHKRTPEHGIKRTTSSRGHDVMTMTSSIDAHGPSWEISVLLIFFKSQMKVDEGQ